MSRTPLLAWLTAVLLLAAASDAAAYITGQTIHVNGGMTMV